MQMRIKQVILVCSITVLVLVAILSQVPFYSENNDESASVEEPMDEVHTDEPVGEEPRDENLFETDIAVTQGNCVSALYPLRNGDILKLSDNYELTARHIDGVNKEIGIEFSENGVVVNDENLTTSNSDETWDICFFQENE
ncbi:MULTISPECIES: hypothetical protein [Methanococcoides]|uniref:hypothetical protein n=1 Tax=Methanococcoides TaxID=2225 RepID=UPI00064EC7C1|nr:MULTISPECIES: hypothetical protein [Methanococcoides]UGV39807.1 hypothetical protein J7W08_06635 [Methanococcoides orientis]